jgi:hypothetical protein
MSDKPLRWPNVAAEARNRAAEEAVKAERALTPLVEGERAFTETERLRREAIALNAVQMISRLLEGVGAPTRA